jgi:RNA 2',3'-cyclic 3'-phosphodiesterase
MALELPALTRAGIEAWGREALADPALRRVAAESLHLTLVFLGHRPEEEIARLAEVLAGLDEEAPELSLGDPVTRPERGEPRLFALPVESPGAISLQAGLERELVSEGLHEPEERPFWPHLTVARVRPRGRGSRRPQRVRNPPGPLPEAPWRTHVRSVRASLYRSELKSQGATYTRLAHIDLPGSGQH